VENFEVRVNNKIGHVIYNLLGLWKKKCSSDNKEVAAKWKKLFTEEQIKEFVEIIFNKI